MKNLLNLLGVIEMLIATIVCIAIVWSPNQVLIRILLTDVVLFISTLIFYWVIYYEKK